MAGHPPKVRVHRHRFPTAGTPPGWAVYVEKQVTAWPHVRVRPFFQWTGFYLGRRCFAATPRSLRSSDLLVRADAALRTRLLQTGTGRAYLRGSTSEWVRVRVTSSIPNRSVRAALRAAYRDASRGVRPGTDQKSRS